MTTISNGSAHDRIEWVCQCQTCSEPRRHLHSIAIDRLLRKYAKAGGLDHGYSALSMRATFITPALNNGASLEDVQRDVGHANSSIIKLYDRRGHNPEKSASFFATYQLRTERWQGKLGVTTGIGRFREQTPGVGLPC